LANKQNNTHTHHTKMKVSSRQILLLSSTIIAILSATICTLTTAFIPSYNTRSNLAIIKPSSTLKETILQQESGERSSSYQEGRGRGRGEYGRGRGRGGPGGRGGRGTIFCIFL